MPRIEALSVKIGIDKRFGKLVNRTCKAIKSLANDRLITAEDADMIIDRALTQLGGFITVGKVKESLSKKE